MAERLDERGEAATATHGADRSQFSARETRQAGMGARVLLVLAASLLLALLVWGSVEWGWVGTGSDQADYGQSAPQSSSQQQPDVDQRPSTERPEGLAPTDRNPTPQSGSGAPTQNTAPDDTNR
ncbi:hypothetical protein ACIQUG_21725 [Ensifer sp. NPDC090286]|uniref:hypothetical protein n=1 Tax=Ensifer sp. NPDC090286 TaxID=3363991 RepID=UPI00383BF51A